MLNQQLSSLSKSQNQIRRLLVSCWTAAILRRSYQRADAAHAVLRARDAEAEIGPCVAESVVWSRPAYPKSGAGDSREIGGRVLPKVLELLLWAQIAGWKGGEVN